MKKTKIKLKLEDTHHKWHSKHIIYPPPFWSLLLQPQVIIRRGNIDKRREVLARGKFDNEMPTSWSWPRGKGMYCGRKQITKDMDEQRERTVQPIAKDHQWATNKPSSSSIGKRGGRKKMEKKQKKSSKKWGLLIRLAFQSIEWQFNNWSLLLFGDLCE